MLRFIAIWIGAMAFPQNPPAGQAAPQEPKARVPDKAVQERIGKEVRILFKEDYAKRGRADRKALAEKLLSEADRSPSETDTRFVLLAEAKDLAAEAMEIDLALAAARKITDLYDLTTAGPKGTRAAFRLETLEPARKSARSPDDARALANACVRLSREALGEGDFDGAGEAARQASTAARSSRIPALIKEAQDLAREVESLRREFGDVQKAESLLSGNPNDPEANLALGRFLCFVKGDWEKGLPRLSKGSDAGLQAVADRELTQPKEPPEQAEVGDAWYELAQKEKKTFLKDRYLGRAREWYHEALSGLQGVPRLRIQKRIEELARLGALSGRIPVIQGLIGAWNLDEGRGTALADSSPHGNAGILMNAGPSGSWTACPPFSRPVLVLDGLDDYAKIGGEKTWNTLDREITVAAWAWWDKPQPGFRGILTRQIGSGSGNHYYVGILNGNFICYLTSVTITDPREFPCSQWVHIAYTGDGSTLRLYRDGKEVQSIKASISYAKDSTPLIIGGDRNGTEEPAVENFGGRLARIRIYNRALSAAEISLLAQLDR